MREERDGKAKTQHGTAQAKHCIFPNSSCPSCLVQRMTRDLSSESADSSTGCLAGEEMGVKSNYQYDSSMSTEIDTDST